jgi:hypothetical protein
VIRQKATTDRQSPMLRRSEAAKTATASDTARRNGRKATTVRHSPMSRRDALRQAQGPQFSQRSA